MAGWIIFISLTILSIGGYLVWPSRYNIPTHLNVGFVVLAYFIPALIINMQDDFPDDVVDLYVKILFVGTIFYLAGLILGFKLKPRKTNFTFDVLSAADYEAHVTKITRILLCLGIPCMILGYLMMGFVPMFAADPVAAKFFRGPYQVPFYTSIVYLSSFLILSSITPISIMIWYKNKSKIFYLLATIVAVVLMMMSLSRGPAFTGVLFGIMIVMSFKSRSSFTVLIVLTIFIYVLSSAFYYIIGVRNLEDVSATLGHDDHVIWRIMAGGTNDVYDQLNFMTFFKANPEWTYGRTVFGGFVPSHYKWNSSVYTLRVINPGVDISELISGGLRLPGPVWGYVSFQWAGVIIFSFLSGLIKGVLLKHLKYWITQHKSILTATVLIVIFITLLDQLSSFYTLSIYALPPFIVLMFYVYRFRLR